MVLGHIMGKHDERRIYYGGKKREEGTDPV
mgnify:CR=1 FL=1